MNRRFLLLVPGLVAALALAAPSAVSAASFLDRAREAVRDAGKQVEGAAKDAGRSVRDFLTDNPDLNRDVVDFGAKVGVPGFEAAKPAAGALATVFPTAGAPGADVLVRASGLPGDAAVTIGAAAPGAATEPLDTAKTSTRGTVDVVVKAPASIAGKPAVVFVVETADGRVRLASEAFQVKPASEASDAIIVTGTLSAEGAECPALRGDDGKLYTLTGPNADSFPAGDRVRVAGTLAAMSTCQQGTTIAVEDIAAVK